MKTTEIWASADRPTVSFELFPARSGAREIDSGSFAREWQRPLSGLKLKALRLFATRQKLNSIERKVRARLGCSEIGELDIDQGEVEDAGILDDPRIRAELESFEQSFEY